jgi:hypothetical protein
VAASLNAWQGGSASWAVTDREYFKDLLIVTKRVGNEEGLYTHLSLSNKNKRNILSKKTN